MKRSISLVFVFVLSLGCAKENTAPPAAAAPAAPAVQAHAELGKWGVDLPGMDKSVKPGDDFFMFVNGSWYKTAEIPVDRSSAGSFQNLRILSEKRMVEIAGGLD